MKGEQTMSRGPSRPAYQAMLDSPAAISGVSATRPPSHKLVVSSSSSSSPHFLDEGSLDGLTGPELVRTLT